MEAKLNNNKYFKAAHIKEPLILTVYEVTYSIKYENYELSFVEVECKLSLNQTNLGTMIDKFKSDTNKWLHQVITLKVETVQYKGQNVPGMRIEVF